VTGLEQELKDFVRSRGVEVVGVAGPERMDGPPSLDLGYTMEGARSVVSMALPMQVGPIYDFLSKESPAPHNLDQFLKYQRLQRIEQELADHIASRGYRAKAAPMSADYRRSLYVFSTRPSLSLRLAAIAAGVGAQGWSGNLMTRESGAAVYLGAVVTDAVLESDEMIPPDYFIDSRCSACRRCVNSCPSRMFEGARKEYVLSSGQLHQRGRRRNIDLCNISCFGLHSLNLNRKSTNWGLNWIEGWVMEEPDPDRRLSMLLAMLRRGLTTGNSAPRFEILRRLCSILFPEELLESTPNPEELPGDEKARYAVLADFSRKVGVKGIDDYPIPMICGQCALVCGPTAEETEKRYRLLAGSGYVVPGPGGTMTRVETFEEAVELRRLHPLRVSTLRKLKDTLDNAIMWHRHYFGFEPVTAWRARVYRRRLAEAVAELSDGGRGDL
jgi:ferredoxin